MEPLGLLTQPAILIPFSQSISQSRADLPTSCIIMNRLGIGCGSALEVRAFLSTEPSENNLNGAAINVDVIVLRDTSEKSVADCASHLLGHGESCRGCRGDNSGGVFRVGHAVGLGEFERSKVGQGFVGGESVLNLGETDAVGNPTEDQGRSSPRRRSSGCEESVQRNSLVVEAGARDEGRVGDSRDSRAGAIRPSEVKRRCCEG
ncbi:hypothetical protein KCU92_g70, partial [Aureobasidium melanogenum]